MKYKNQEKAVRLERSHNLKSNLYSTYNNSLFIIIIHRVVSISVIKRPKEIHYLKNTDGNKTIGSILFFLKHLYD